MAGLVRRGLASMAASASGLASARPFKTVIIEGNIASGKTEFLQFFKQYSNAKIFAEPIEKWRYGSGFNLLDLMYSDPSRWSLTFQTYVQLTMLDLHTKTDGVKAGDTKVMERSIYSAKYCFVENLHNNKYLQDPEYAVLTQWFDWIIRNTNCSADLIIYLKTRPETVYERLVKRQRPEERRLPLEYLQALHQLHEDWLIHEKFPCPKVQVIDANADLSDLRPIYEKAVREILSIDPDEPAVMNGELAM